MVKLIVAAAATLLLVVAVVRADGRAEEYRRGMHAECLAQGSESDCYRWSDEAGGWR